MNGIKSVSVASPTPSAPIRLKTYSGFRVIEYGPTVTNSVIFRPAIYKEHHILPREAMAASSTPIENKIELKKGL